MVYVAVQILLYFFTSPNPITQENIVSLRVALVEDSTDIRSSMSLLIASAAGFECVLACASGEEALAAIPALKPDIVLMDIELPGISGIEAMSRLRAAGFAGQFMMLTVFMDERNIFNALQAGANGYLLKNTPPAELLAAIAELHAGGAPMTSQIARLVLASFHSHVHAPLRSPQHSPAHLSTPQSASVLAQSEKQSNEDMNALTPREEEILHLLTEGLRYKAIAEKFFISPATVRTHIHNIYQKLQVTSRAEAVAKVLAGK
jgi:DNA-binding NarL/FixJ family response regulator